MTIERIEGETPRGGTYMVMAYFTEDGSEATRDNWTHCLASEHAANGDWLFESVIVREWEPVRAEHEDGTIGDGVREVRPR